jgi:hypothetical protein
MINWIIALSLSVIGGFLTASMLFSVPQFKQACICLGRFRFLGMGFMIFGIIVIPAFAVLLPFFDSLFLDHLLGLWVTTLFLINLFIFIGVGIIDGQGFWKELHNSRHKQYLSGEIFDFCYTPADFDFIREQVARHFAGENGNAEMALSKIFTAYRDKNLDDYRKFILVTHAAAQVLSPDDRFWTAYREWGVNPGNYIALKELSLARKPA